VYTKEDGLSGFNYHANFKKHYHSVLYTVICNNVEIKTTSRIAEIFHRCRRVASHLRDDILGRYATEEFRMPSRPKRRKENWSRETFIRCTLHSIGPQSCEFIKELLGSKRHPEQAYKS